MTVGPRRGRCPTRSRGRRTTPSSTSRGTRRGCAARRGLARRALGLRLDRQRLRRRRHARRHAGHAAAARAAARRRRPRRRPGGLRPDEGRLRAARPRRRRVRDGDPARADRRARRPDRPVHATGRCGWPTAARCSPAATPADADAGDRRARPRRLDRRPAPSSAPPATTTASATSLPLGDLLAQVADGVGVDVAARPGCRRSSSPSRASSRGWARTSIPLWLPRPEYDGMPAHDPTPSFAAGLSVRPLAETTRDTLAWLRATPDARGERHVPRPGARACSPRGIACAG